MIYLDTNIPVSLLTHDSQSASVVAWFEAQLEPLAISAWVCTEFNAVAGLRKRKGELTAAVARIAIEALDSRKRKNFSLLAVTDAAAALAASWLQNPDCALRSGDALHLAIASEGGATTLATLDEQFANAARKLKLANLRVVLITDPPKRVEQKRATYRVKRVPAKK